MRSVWPRKSIPWSEEAFLIVRVQGACLHSVSLGRQVPSGFIDAHVLTLIRLIHLERPTKRAKYDTPTRSSSDPTIITPLQSTPEAEETDTCSTEEESQTPVQRQEQVDAKTVLLRLEEKKYLKPN